MGSGQLLSYHVRAHIPDRLVLLLLHFKLPYLLSQPLSTILVLSRQVIHLLHGIVDLRHARAHLVQAAVICRETNTGLAACPSLGGRGNCILQT